MTTVYILPPVGIPPRPWRNDAAPVTRCTECDGAGQYPYGGHLVLICNGCSGTGCRDCRGTGEQIQLICDECAGDGCVEIDPDVECEAEQGCALLDRPHRPHTYTRTTIRAHDGLRTDFVIDCNGTGVVEPA